MSQKILIQPCKFCIFAKYKDKTQTGCHANRIYKMRQNGYNIVKAYDEEAEFFLIYGQCHMFRDKNLWSTEFDLTQPIEDLIKKARQQVNIEYNAMIMANESLHDIETTVDSLLNQQRKPKRITVIQTVNNNIRGISKLLQDKCVDMEWRVEKLVREETLDNIITLCLKYKPQPIFSLLYAGTVIPKKTFITIEQLVVDECKVFSYIKGNTNNGLTIPLSIWEYARLCDKQTTLKFLLEIGEQSKWDIYKIVPNFPQ